MLVRSSLSHTLSISNSLSLSPTPTQNYVRYSAGKPLVGGPLNAEKLRAKAVQFFPNINLSIEEINQTPPVRYVILLYCTILYYTIPTVLYYTVLFYTILYYTILY